MLRLLITCYFSHHHAYMLWYLIVYSIILIFIKLYNILPWKIAISQCSKYMRACSQITNCYCTSSSYHMYSSIWAWHTWTHMTSYNSSLYCCLVLPLFYSHSWLLQPTVTVALPVPLWTLQIFAFLTVCCSTSILATIMQTPVREIFSHHKKQTNNFQIV